MTDDLENKLLIRELIERWAVWRDAGDWERFATDGHAHAQRSGRGGLVSTRRAVVSRRRA
jgi:hypothetical protein